MSSRSAIQHDADDYAETVLRYFSTGDETLPALPDPERETLDCVAGWLEMKYEITRDQAVQIAGAAVGHAREELGLAPDDDEILYLVEGAE